MLKKISFILIIFLITNSKTLIADQILIKVTVNDEIITSYDIQKEANYLKFLNPKLSQVENNRVLKLAKNSLINEIVKRKEIEKNLKVDGKNPLVDQYFQDLIKRLNFENEKDFIESLRLKKSYNSEEVREKLYTEIMWNELIYLRYNRQVKIDKSSLINKIDNLDNKQRKEYLLSEIVFQKKKDEDLNILKKKIKESILEIGFNNTANIFSLSESSKMGGNIGWVSENNLSNIILNKIKNINENEMTDIILIGNNYLIIKVNKIRFKEININKEEELEKMIKFETNNQLNKLSRIFFSKSIMNYSINEN